MKRYAVLPGVALLSAAFVVVTSGPVAAIHLPLEFDKDDQRCRAAISKGFSKAVSTAAKLGASCHKLRDKGSLPDTTDCNDISASGADPKDKYGRAADKLSNSITKKCIEANASQEVLDEYVSCPEPCATETGVSNPLATFAELDQCLGCLGREIVGTLLADIVGTPTPQNLSSVERKCHTGIAKQYTKLFDTVVKDRAKCQKLADKIGHNDIEECSTSDSGKIAKALDKADRFAGAFCVTGVSLADVDSCSTAGILDLKACLQSLTDAAGTDAFAAAYELDSTVCPVRIDSTTLAGFGLAGASRTRLEVGWTGFAHDADLPDLFILSADLDCPAEPPCGDCPVLGISSDGPQFEFYARCVEDLAVACTNPFGTDGACPGLQDCTYVLGPPLPISSANNPTCNVSKLAQDITGTVNPDDGSSELDVQIATLTHAGGSGTLTRPCPVCAGACSASTVPCVDNGQCISAYPTKPGDALECVSGFCVVKCVTDDDCSAVSLGTCDTDTTPQDGVREGTCFGGQHRGEACDIQAFDATFAPNAFNEGLSLDCPPAPATNVSGQGLKIGLEFTTGHTSLAFENQCDALALDCAIDGDCCACGVCSGDITLPCRNDTECDDVGAGTCTSTGGGAQRQPNDCFLVATGTACADQGDEIGECAGGGANDQTRFCSGVTRAGSGGGFVLCNNNSDCDGSDCGGVSCGTCTLVQTKPCFLDPIEADGDPDVDNPLLVTTFCIPPTINVAINETGGIPGPARLHTDMVVERAY